jgi:ribosomal protein L24
MKNIIIQGKTKTAEAKALQTLKKMEGIKVQEVETVEKPKKGKSTKTAIQEMAGKWADKPEFGKNFDFKAYREKLWQRGRRK